uniref:Uncharacterized protein n=1 Tax=Molossus molossus TaxID=27622 RepID=A0A7J8ERH2_MOLMO|nr:hypothetical protein HJG59_008641 [Molossus molossus]
MAQDGDAGRSEESSWPLSTVLSYTWNLSPDSTRKVQRPLPTQATHSHLPSVPGSSTTRRRLVTSRRERAARNRVLGVGGTFGAQLPDHAGDDTPRVFHSSTCRLLQDRGQGPTLCPSALSKVSDPRSPFSAATPPAGSPPRRAGGAAASSPAQASWPLEALSKHHQPVMPTSFLGENKSYFSLFFSLDGENQDPF